MEWYKIFVQCNKMKFRERKFHFTSWNENEMQGNFVGWNEMEFQNFILWQEISFCFMELNEMNSNFMKWNFVEWNEMK